MRRLRLLYARVLERAYLRTIQSRYVGGTDPDDGGHMMLQAACNFKNGDNRPIFAVIMTYSKKPRDRTRIIMSPAQADAFNEYFTLMLVDQQESFGWMKAPDYDTRYIRVPDTTE